MKTSDYRKLLKQMCLFLLVALVIVSIFLIIVIYLYSSYVGLEAAKGNLETTSFAYFYIHHSWEANSLLFALALMCVLSIFIFAFVNSMNTLLLVLQGEIIVKEPVFFRLFPIFHEAKKHIEELLNQQEIDKMAYVESMEEKNELLMYLAHDLKTPLTSMIGYVSYLLDHHLDDEHKKESLSIASLKAKRMDALIDEFTQLLRYDDQVNSLDLSYFDLSKFLKDQLSGFYPLLAKKHFNLIEQIEEPLYINADYDKLFRVFDNLMRNAMNYAASNSDIIIVAKKQGNMVYISYSNEVENMSKAQVSHLFDKFYRGEEARSSMSGGAGLGLAIAKEIIELHGGSIDVELEDKIICFKIMMKGANSYE